VLAPSVRLYNYIKKLGANQDQIESFIANLANSPEPEKLIDVANQVAQLSRSESIPLEELEGHVKQKEEEKQMPEDETKERRAILESTKYWIGPALSLRHHQIKPTRSGVMLILDNIAHFQVRKHDNIFLKRTISTGSE
jgi:hypothetical protein